MKISPFLLSSSLVRRFAGGLAVAAMFSLVGTAPAATLGSDNAGNYASWTNGSNGGTGFGAWSFVSNDGGGVSPFAGYFLGDSTSGTGGNINTGAQSFGMYANPGGAFANASRTFSGGALTLGQKFSMQMTVAFRNGDKGLNLLSGATQVFNFDIGQAGTGTDGYYYTTAGGAVTSTGFAYFADSVFTLSYTQQTATAGMFTISRTSATGGAGATNSVSGTFTASGVTSFTVYNSNATNAAGDNLYFNNLAVVPEPSAIALIAAGLTGLVVVRRRRR